MTKQEILGLLEDEINDAEFIFKRGKRDLNEICTNSLLIQFSWDNENDRSEMTDIIISRLENDPTEMCLYACELNDEQVISILKAAKLEEFANDMDVEIK